MQGHGHIFQVTRHTRALGVETGEIAAEAKTFAGAGQQHRPHRRVLAHPVGGIKQVDGQLHV